MKSIFQALIGLGAMALATSAIAQPYPSKLVRIIVPFPAGSPTDIPARLMADGLKDTFGQAVIIDNRVGAGGLIGSQAAARSPADGYTLMFSSTAPSITAFKILNKESDFDILRDLTVVANVAEGVNGFHVHPSIPVSSMQELIAYINARPGKLNYGSAGIGTSNHVLVEYLKNRAGIDIVHVPFPGMPPAINATISNEVQVILGDVFTFRPHVVGGKLKLLAVGSPKPTPLAPGAPTVASTANVPDFDSTYFFSVFAPNGTPGDVLNHLNNVISGWANGAGQKRLSELGFVPVRETREESRQRVAATVERFVKAGTAAGLKK